MWEGTRRRGERRDAGRRAPPRAEARGRERAGGLRQRRRGGGSAGARAHLVEVDLVDGADEEDGLVAQLLLVAVREEALGLARADDPLAVLVLRVARLVVGEHVRGAARGRRGAGAAAGAGRLHAEEVVEQREALLDGRRRLGRVHAEGVLQLARDKLVSRLEGRHLGRACGRVGRQHRRRGRGGETGGGRRRRRRRRAGGRRSGGGERSGLEQRGVVGRTGDKAAKANRRQGPSQPTRADGHTRSKQTLRWPSSVGLSAPTHLAGAAQG